MERDCRRLKFPPKRGGQQVLPCVLLHVIEPSLPVDPSLDGSTHRKRIPDEMPNRAILVLLHLFHGNRQRRSIGRGGGQCAYVERLTAACRVEDRMVQRKLPDR